MNGQQILGIIIFMKYILHVRTRQRVESVQPSNAGPNTLEIQTKEAPHEDKANRAVISLLADYFSVAKSEVKIISGLHGKTKVIEISDEAPHTQEKP